MKRPATLAFDFSGFGLRIEGLPPPWRRRLATLWRGFECGTPPPSRTLGVEVIQLPGWLAEPAAFDPKSMEGSRHPLGTRFTLPLGVAEPAGPDAVRIEIAEGLSNRRFYSFVNLCRAAFGAWLPSRGGVLVHAAGIVVHERAFLLVGGGGAGKSTFAQLAARAGATVLGDDLVLVDTAPERPEAVAAPLRPESMAPPARGRWPVASLLLPEHGSPPRLSPVAELETQVHLVANLPFLETRVGRDEAVTRVLQRLAAVPARRLRFAPDPSFLDLLR